MFPRRSHFAPSTVSPAGRPGRLGDVPSTVSSGRACLDNALGVKCRRVSGALPGVIVSGDAFVDAFAIAFHVRVFIPRPVCRLEPPR